MIALLALLAQLLHAALMLAAAPIVLGVVRLLRARLAGRRGPSVLQPWRDLLRLARKQPVLADHATGVGAHGPMLALTCTLAACLLVPSFTLGMATAPMADLLVIAGLFVLGRCTVALAAMDVGTPFGGMGASRVMTYGAFSEPALLMVILTLSLLAGTTNLDVIAGLLRDGGAGPRIALGFALAAMLAVALTESGRLPVDDDAGRLELAMVPGAMRLEFSGRQLAFLQAEGSLRLLVWMTLIATVFAPFGIAGFGSYPLAWLLGLVLWAAKIAILAAALAMMEFCATRMRLLGVPALLSVAALLGVLAAIFLFVSTGFA